jgi:FKBP-type peptidyl-prolyl cis-trans isomerase 2
MRTVEKGDRVQVHYVKRFQDGSVVSSRSRGKPLELTVGTAHPRLPGLGLALVGSSPGSRVTLALPAEQAYGLNDPGRIRRVARKRISDHQELPVGKWVRITDVLGRRPVRIVEIRDRVVLIDTNHPRAGQSLEMEIEVIAIQALDAPQKQ